MSAVTRDALIEAAARAVYEGNVSASFDEWDEVPLMLRARYLESQAHALDAVLPMIAQGLDDAYYERRIDEIDDATALLRSLAGPS